MKLLTNMVDSEKKEVWQYLQQLHPDFKNLQDNSLLQELVEEMEIIEGQTLEASGQKINDIKKRANRLLTRLWDIKNNKLRDWDDLEKVDKRGRYGVLREKGKGTMGVVREVWDKINKKVAVIKTIAKKYESDKRGVARFKREVKALSSLKHTGYVVAAYDVLNLEDDGSFGVVVDYAPGTDLNQLIKLGEFGNADQEQRDLLIASIGIQICLGLEAIHNLGLVHRDVKPANIMVDNGGKVRM